MADNPLIPKAKNEINYFVNARQKTYKYSTEIYIPYNPYEKLQDGYEPSKKVIPKGSANTTSEEEKTERALRRAHTTLKDIVLSNDFSLFVTFTFKAGREDPDLCKRKMNGWLKRQRKVDKSFQYAVVPEFHSDGISLHFHALISDYKGEITEAINPNTGKPLIKKRRKVYDFPNYTLGHSEVYFIGDTEEDRIRSAFYLLKYLKKDMPTFKNKKRYWTSRGLKKPQVIENPEEWYFGLVPDHKIATEYGEHLYFSNNRIKEFLHGNKS